MSNDDARAKGVLHVIPQPSSTFRIVLIDVFCAVSAPPRLVGRMLMSSRSLCSGLVKFRQNDTYAQGRYGPYWRFRPWLLLDVAGLRDLEDLINGDNDKKVLAYMKTQNTNAGMVAIVGALVAQAGISALQLPSLSELHYAIRLFFILSLVMSLLGVFFAVLQQRIFGLVSEPEAIRSWLSNGTSYRNANSATAKQSSQVSYWVLDFPFEIVSIAITFSLIGFAFSLGFATSNGSELSTGHRGNILVLATFIVATLWTASASGLMLGLKDLEEIRGDKQPVPHSKATATSLLSDSEEGVVEGTSSKTCEGCQAKMKKRLQLLEAALRDSAAAHKRCAAKDEKVADLLTGLKLNGGV